MFYAHMAALAARLTRVEPEVSLSSRKSSCLSYYALAEVNRDLQAEHELIEQELREAQTKLSEVLGRTSGTTLPAEEGSMDMREAFGRIQAEYSAATKQDFAKHPLAQFIRSEVASALRDAATGFGGLIFDASAGAGNWADGPWAAVFDPLITDTAQEGFYPVYLFARDLSAVYISMNQGVTSLKNEVGVTTAREVLKSRAAVMRARVAKELAPRFSGAPIALQSAKAGSNLDLYEAGHAFGKQYSKGHLPPEAELRADLKAMLEIYAVLRNRGGYDDLGEPEKNGGSGSPTEKLEEARRRFLHERIERRRALALKAKKVHGHTCQVCGFNFGAQYGLLGANYIIAHHKTPLAILAAQGPVSLSPKDDFAVVCANCHGMIHAPGAPPTFEGFIAYFQGLHPVQ